MGKKSDKKIKSDRLNALRKQYDSFIEEGKKRKERNDYILQSLDKICYSTSSGLQLRPKTVYCEYPQPSFGQHSYNRFDYRPDKMKRNNDVIPSNHPLAQPNLQLDIPRQFDDISILREISKKYILIPKFQTTMFNNYMATNPVTQDNNPVQLQPEPQSNVRDNNDWRSKYDILEQLKKENEDNNNKPTKEEMVPPKTQFYQSEPDSILKNNSNDNVLQNIKSDMLAKYKAELPEKDLPDYKFKTGNDLQAMDDMKISDNAREESVTNIEQPSNLIESNVNYNLALEELPVAESGVCNNNTDKEQTLNIGTDFVDTDYVSEDVSYQPPQEQINIHNEEPIEYLDMNQTNNVYQSDNVYQDYPNKYEQNEPNVETTQYQENELTGVENMYSPIPVTQSEPLEYLDMNQTNNVYQSDNVYQDNNEYQDNSNEYQQHEPVVEANQCQNNEFKVVENVYSAIPVTESDPLQEPSTAFEVNKVEDDLVYPLDVINVQDFTPDDNVELQDGMNINPEYGATNQENNLKSNNDQPLQVNEPIINQGQVPDENIANNSGIETFDTQQKAMSYTYDQGGAGEPYDPEFIPNQEFQENAAYNYYENEQQDAYPVAINEHEETSERYDHNYHQQFVTNHDGFVQQEDLNQQYEQAPTEEYQQQAQYQEMDQDYRQYNYEQENQNTIADVEHQLDRENGI